MCEPELARVAVQETNWMRLSSGVLDRVLLERLEGPTAYRSGNSSETTQDKGDVAMKRMSNRTMGLSQGTYLPKSPV